MHPGGYDITTAKDLGLLQRMLSLCILLMIGPFLLGVRLAKMLFNVKGDI